MISKKKREEGTSNLKPYPYLTRTCTRTKTPWTLLAYMHTLHISIHFIRFMEVCCTSSGKIRRFAAGTEAGFALCVINKKIENGASPALYIEACKEGEEPITFGPNATLVNYGKEWKLQTVTERGFGEAKPMQQISKRFSNTMNLSSARSPNGTIRASHASISFWYIGKIIFAFFHHLFACRNAYFVSRKLPALIFLCELRFVIMYLFIYLWFNHPKE
ncbi:uncharacterized protein LOC109843916 isoform X2 [Asparagus officinalis]|uniref:uncharacterized protein LOC109843916 isoform X2 n=1 Tax=Asparagus officinalis TaxID=4686 RepID=UPI00098E4541|nr:uncharacterized protein LOC109843916 isoform X2 [Asparagus officinalis]